MQRQVRWIVIAALALATLRPAGALAQDAGDGPATDADAIRAGWHAWHAGLCYPLTGTDPHRADEFASRAVGVPWDEFCRTAPVPAGLVVELTRWAVKLRTLRRLVRTALGTPEREELLDTFDVAGLCRVMPALRQELGTDDGVFASPAEAAEFARELEAGWPQTWGNWLGRLTAERAADVLLARTAEELFPCDPLLRDTRRGERRALELAGTDSWDAFTRRAMKLPDWAAIQQRVTRAAEQAEALRRLACGAGTWREARRGEWGALAVPPAFASADELRRFAALFAHRFSDVWTNWTLRFSPAATWEIILRFHAGRLAGLAGVNDEAGRAMAERYAGVGWDDVRALGSDFDAMQPDGLAWGQRAAALRGLLTTPATAAATRAGRLDVALAHPSATSASELLGGAIRGAAFAGQFQRRFPAIWRRWAEGINSDEIREVLMARAAWQYAPSAEDPQVVDPARADVAVLQLASMDAGEWLKLAAAHERYPAIAADAEAFARQVAMLRRVYQHPDTFRAARRGDVPAVFEVAARLHLVSGMTDASQLAALDQKLRESWPDLIAGWCSDLSPFLVEEWFRQYALGLLQSPTDDDPRRARRRAEAYFQDSSDEFEAMLQRRPDASALRARGQQFLRSLRALRTLVMEPATFGIVRHSDFAAIWDNPDLRLIATRDGAFDSPAHATEFAQLIAARYPDVWQGWLSRLTEDLARTVCRTWVAGLLHRSDDNDDAAFASAFVREQLGLEWDTLVAEDFRLEPDEAARVRTFLETHTRQVRVLRALMCHADTRESARMFDLRTALTLPAGLRANVRNNGFQLLGDARPVAQQFAAEFPSVWKGWRVRVELDEQRAREILEEWLAGRHAEPDATRLSDAQGERMVQAAAGTPWSDFVDQLARRSWGARVDAETTAGFGRKVAALRVLVLQPSLRALLRDGRVADARAEAPAYGSAVQRAAATFASADDLHQFVQHIQRNWPALWASWCHANEPAALRAELAWLAFHVAGWRTDAHFDAAAARAALSVVTRQAAEDALRDPTIVRLRAGSHDLSGRVRLLRQLLSDPATRAAARAFDFSSLAADNRLTLDGRQVFASSGDARSFAHTIHDDFPAIWNEWCGRR